VRITIRANETGLLTPDLLGEEITPQAWAGDHPKMHARLQRIHAHAGPADHPAEMGFPMTGARHRE
jgi:hypothetical protein